MKRLILLGALVHCGSSTPPPQAAPLPPPPPLASAPVPATPEAPPDSGPPVVATFIDLNAMGAPLKARTCEQVVVTVVKGKANAHGDDLSEGDFLVTSGEGSLTVKGTGLALAAAVRTEPCTPRTAKDPAPPLTHKTIRASAAPELTWAGGKMHAHLDVEKDLTGAYVGRLQGTAGVPEHSHDGSWEILGAIDGRGTFTVDGKPKQLGPRDVVAIPPKTKHSWTPDAGTTLVAIQFYWPAGPEQRFRDLARTK
jgi:quercetin dioxygenase-like cupin family protein